MIEQDMDLDIIKGLILLNYGGTYVSTDFGFIRTFKNLNRQVDSYFFFEDMYCLRDECVKENEGFDLAPRWLFPGLSTSLFGARVGHRAIFIWCKMMF